MIYDRIIRGLETSLNMRLKNSNIIGSNLANIDTPGYSAKKLEFQDVLDNIVGEPGQNVKMALTDNSHLTLNGHSLNGDMDGRLLNKDDIKPGLDGNNVDLDKEMADFAANNIMYNASAKLIKKKLSILNYAIIGDR